MKNFKIIVLTIIFLIVIMVLASRIKKVLSEESFETRLSGLEEGDEFVAAIYLPLTEEIIIKDSIIFNPRKILVQDDIKLKHRFFIFSSYFEKAPSNGKYLAYQSNGKPNKYRLVIQANRYDTTFNHITFTKGQEVLSSYYLNETVIDPKNEIFEIEDFAKIDTLKFYIKQASIQSSDIGEYIENKTTFKKEPLDSVLFVRKKKITMPNKN